MLNSDMVVFYADENLTKRLIYTHTTVADGVRNNFWERTGTTKTDVDMSEFKFFTSFDDAITSITGIKCRLWSTASQDADEFACIPESRVVGRESGGVKPAAWVYERLEELLCTDVNQR